MPSPALSFVAGLGGGFLSAQQRQQEQDRQAKIDQRAQEDHDARMADIQRQNQDRLSLAMAGRPAQVEVGAGGYTKPDSADNIDVGQPGEPGAEAGGLSLGSLVNGKAYADPAAAQQAATDYNAPGAAADRQAQVLQGQGKPTEALALQSAVTAQKKNAFTLTKEQAEYGRTLANENAFDTARALRTGDPQQIKDAFNKSGSWKIEGDPVVTARTRTDIPGLPEVTTYDATVNLKGPDGQTITKTVNSHDFSMSVLPYEKAMELQQKGQRNEDRAENQAALTDVRRDVGKAQADAAEARARALEEREQRIRNMPSEQERKGWQSQMQDATRNLSELNKAIAAYRTDNRSQLVKDPNGTEAQALNEMIDQRKVHQANHDVAAKALSSMFTQRDQGNGGTPSAKPQPMPTDKGQLKAGTVYQTTRGPATWNGSAFEQ